MAESEFYILKLVLISAILIVLTIFQVLIPLALVAVAQAGFLPHAPLLEAAPLAGPAFHAAQLAPAAYHAAPAYPVAPVAHAAPVAVEAVPAPTAQVVALQQTLVKQVSVRISIQQNNLFIICENANYTAKCELQKSQFCCYKFCIPHSAELSSARKTKTHFFSILQLGSIPS